MNTRLSHRREAIILSTIEAFDELGIQGVSIREIARRQGITEGAIFKHFKNKNELLLAVLDYNAQYDCEVINSTILMNLKPKDAILFAVRSYGEYVENYPQVIAITEVYDVLAHDPELEGKVKEILFTRSNFIQEMAKKAQEAGEIRRDIDSSMIGDTIWGFCRSICLKWKFSNYSFSIKDYMLTTVEKILDGFSSSSFL